MLLEGRRRIAACPSARQIRTDSTKPQVLDANANAGVGVILRRASESAESKVCTPMLC